MALLRYLLSGLYFLAGAEALNKALRIGTGGRTINDFRREAEAESNGLEKRSQHLGEIYPAQYFDMPIDHFPDDAKYAPHLSGTFKNRYWFDTTYYKPGGPVIILQSGETNAIGRLVFMQKGILQKLSKATGGLSVVFEHRYYGHSFPTRTLSTDNLRYLTTEQALADEAYFAQNIVFPGMEGVDLSSNSTAWISYGGSYAGAFSAFLRVQYPDVFWGSISSSGVTKAIYDYWAYYDPVAQYGPPAAMALQKLFTGIFDKILMGTSASMIESLKTLFGLQHVTNNIDFANQLAQGVGWWQSLNWDPAINYPEFYEFAGNLSAEDVLWPDTESKRSMATSVIEAGGYASNTTLENQLLNYVGWIDWSAVSPCQAEGKTQNECFTNLNKTFYEQDDLGQYNWRSWAYQYCTEWGFLQTGSGVPADQQSVISRTINLEYLSTVCREAFGIYHPPDLQEANQYGGYDIKYSRLAIIDGQWDPWRPATPHAYQFGAPHRPSTTDEPFILIHKALHHYDEYGIWPNHTTPTLPPPPVAECQTAEEEFVQAWVQEWNDEQKKKRK